MNVVVTGGGTVAPIDDVRQITNASTGRFSALITEACLARGAEVWHIHTPAALLPFERQARFDLRADPVAERNRLARLQTAWRTARNRLHLVPLAQGTVANYARTLQHVLTVCSIEVAFLAMAVSDYEPIPITGKLVSGDASLTLTCRPTPKIIRSVRAWAPEVYLVGFKLLSGATEADLIREAEAACRVNRADLTVANDQRTVRAGRQIIHLVRPGAAVEAYGPGDEAADRLVERALTWAREKIASREPIPREGFGSPGNPGLL